MGEDITVRESGIYLLNRVEVTLKDDSRAEGILQNIAAETITVEGREIMLSDVADIRLAGELTDYNVMRDTGMIGNFTFAPEACRDAAELELMRHYNSDWPQKINGEELESVLDGLIFAG